MDREVPIGTAAKHTGLKIPTIRYYEKIGLLGKLSRAENNRRLYNEGTLRRLTFVRHARELGFDLQAIRALLSLQDQPNQSCSVADRVAKARLVEVESRIERLTALKAELQTMIEKCKHDRIAECRVIEVLADHSQCEHERH